MPSSELKYYLKVAGVTFIGLPVALLLAVVVGTGVGIGGVWAEVSTVWAASK